MKHLRINPNIELETIADPNIPVRDVLIEADQLRINHSLRWVDVEYRGFSMSLDGETPIEDLAKEFESWEKEKGAPG
jgi:hypothetical protein